ncbi:hypothetical protein D3C86_1809260 [compost metagenome]
MGEYAKGIAIALEPAEVGPLVGAHIIFQSALRTISKVFEVMPDGILAGMAKGRIADIMGQTGGTDYRG